VQDEIIKLLKQSGNKGAADAAILCINHPDAVSKLIPCLKDNDKALKNALIKTFSIVSQKSPSALYNHFHVFADLMFDNDKILQWNAIDIVANLAVTDNMDYFDEAMVQRFLNLLEDDSMITASHAVDNLWKIARSKRWALNTITEHLSRVDKIKRNAECSYILTGKAIQTFSKILPDLPDKTRILGFVERHLSNPRPATAKKAELFLNKYMKTL
jgi:hypothetical protein